MIFDNGGSHKHVYPLSRPTGNTVSAKIGEHISIFPKTERIGMDNATHFKMRKLCHSYRIMGSHLSGLYHIRLRY